MQMERCANAWKKERPGSQAAKELGERTQEPTMRGTRTPIQLPPSQGHFSVYPGPGLQGLGANYSLSVPTPMPVSAMTDYICGPPRPGSEPSLLAGRGCREGRVDDVWVRAGEERGRFQHRWRSLDFRLLLLSGAGKMECTSSFFHLCLILAGGPGSRPQCSCQQG